MAWGRERGVKMDATSGETVTDIKMRSSFKAMTAGIENEMDSRGTFMLVQYTE